MNKNLTTSTGYASWRAGDARQALGDRSRAMSCNGHETAVKPNIHMFAHALNHPPRRGAPPQ